MIRVPVPYEPDQMDRQRSTRVRREVNSFDAINARLVESWQTDTPRPQGGVEGRGGRFGMSMQMQYYDMNPTSSRLYDEDLVTAPRNKYVTNFDKRAALSEAIQVALAAVEINPDSQEAQDKYKFLSQKLKQMELDSLSQNPFFDKYDVASDSRNIVRELRASVQEDLSNRGEAESRRMLERSLQGRWSVPRVPVKGSAVGPQTADPLFAYELMRPRVSDTTKVYRT